MFICPYAKAKGDFLVCSLDLEKESDINDLKKALKAYCKEQRYCTCKRRVVNTDNAEECYKKHKQ